MRKADDTGLVCDMKACYKVMELFMVHVSVCIYWSILLLLSICSLAIDAVKQVFSWGLIFNHCFCMVIIVDEFNLLG